MSVETTTLRSTLAEGLRQCTLEPPRSIREFATSDVTIPDGRERGQPFSIDSQPVIGLWFDAIDSGDWTEFVFTAPSQFGKTLSGFVIPLLYHACEIAEPYVLGVPYADMAANKYEADIDPVLKASPRLRRLRPQHGSGSAGGRVRDSVTYANGSIVKFMSAGSGDAGKAGFTARVFGITEAKAFSEIREASDEADPLRQLRARQRSYPAGERQSYIEGTLGKSDQLPWTLKPLSSDSRIQSPCPHCKEHISCEREHLQGWQKAKSEEAAAKNAHFVCPECESKITEAQRLASLRKAVLVHAGQKVDRKGRVTGPKPKTRRLWFRASAWHNAFLSAGDIARDEWRAAQLPEDSPEQLSAERELCQFVWCIPWDPPKLDTDIPLCRKTINSRRLELPRGIVPADTVRLTMGTDLGAKTGWYLMLATRSDGSRHIPDYGPFDVPSQEMSIAAAIIAALEQLHKHAETGLIRPDGEILIPGERWYDAGYQTTSVLEFVLGKTEGSLTAPDVAAYGRGSTMIERGTATKFNLPKKKSNTIRQIGPDRLWFLEREIGNQNLKLYWDADQTKYDVLQALTIPSDQPGAVTLFSGTSKTHDRLSRHLTNEPLVTEITALGAEKQVFRRKGANHLLDALAMAWRADSRLAWRIKHGFTAVSSGPTNWYEDAQEPTESTANQPQKQGGWYDNA